MREFNETFIVTSRDPQVLFNRFGINGSTLDRNCTAPILLSGTDAWGEEIKTLKEFGYPGPIVAIDRTLAITPEEVAAGKWGILRVPLEELLQTALVTKIPVAKPSTLVYVEPTSGCTPEQAAYSYQHSPTNIFTTGIIGEIKRSSKIYERVEAAEIHARRIAAVMKLADKVITDLLPTRLDSDIKPYTAKMVFDSCGPYYHGNQVERLGIATIYQELIRDDGVINLGVPANYAPETIADDFDTQYYRITQMPALKDTLYTFTAFAIRPKAF